MREKRVREIRTIWTNGLWKCVVTGILLLGLLAGAQSARAAEFSYDYLVPDADVRYMSMDEISRWSLQTVCYAKNEIYARRGWIFQSAELGSYFGGQGWYYGRVYPADFSESIMNDYEIANAKLLQKREYELDPSGYQLDRPGYNFNAIYYDLYGTPYSVAADTGYVIPDSDVRYLSESELRGMSAQELCYARNEIYARHGRYFNSYELMNYFEQKVWYFGYILPDEFSTSVFNEYENANIGLLQDYEYRMYGEYRLDQPGYSYSSVRSIDNYQTYTVSDDSYIFSDSDLRYLSESEVAGMSAQQLCYAKNEIYARHGRLFDSKELRDYFNSKSWYYGWIEPDDFTTVSFNIYELANIELLKKYEYAYAPGGYPLYQ